MKQMTRPTLPPEAQQPQKSEWAKFIAGFGYAFTGLWYALRTQRNVRVHVVMAIFATVLGILLHISALGFALLYVAIAGVFITEMINTVVEVCIDLITPDYHPLAKIAKDVAAGAVLLNAILSVVIGLFVLGPPLWQFLIHYFH